MPPTSSPARSLADAVRSLAAPDLVAFLRDHITIDLASWRWSVIADVTRGCNLRCPMCPHRHEPEGVAAADLWSELASQVLPHASELAIGSLSEPLLHPRLSEELGRLRTVSDGLAHRPSVCLLTSGTLLTEDLGENLLAARPHALLLSVDVTDPEVYHRVRRPAHWSRLREALAALLAHPRARDVSIAVQSLVMRSTLEYLASTVRELAALGIRRFQIAQLQVGPAEDEVIRFEGEDGEALEQMTHHLRKVAMPLGVSISLPRAAAPVTPGSPWPVFGEGAIWDEDRLGRERATVCVSSWYKLHIDHQGWVFPCPHKDDPALAWGNLLESPLGDIVNGPLARHAREAFLAGRAPDRGCEQCPFGQGGRR